MRKSDEKSVYMRASTAGVGTANREGFYRSVQKMIAIFSHWTISRCLQSESLWRSTTDLMATPWELKSHVGSQAPHRWRRLGHLEGFETERMHRLTQMRDSTLLCSILSNRQLFVHRDFYVSTSSRYVSSWFLWNLMHFSRASLGLYLINSFCSDIYNSWFLYLQNNIISLFLNNFLIFLTFYKITLVFN